MPLSISRVFRRVRLVRGFTPDIVEKLRPWIAVLPQPTEINVNTAQSNKAGYRGAACYVMRGERELLSMNVPGEALMKSFVVSLSNHERRAAL